MKTLRIFRNLWLVFFCLLAACIRLPDSAGGNQPSQSGNTIPQGSITPIPNLFAENVLDSNFDLFLAHLALTDWTRSPEEFMTEVEEGAFILDVRQPLDVGRNGFIPGAVLIPLREISQKTSLLPDYSVPVYAYSSDTWRCSLLVSSLGVFGWEIRCLEGGFEAWIAAGGDVEQGRIPYPEVDPLKPAFPCCGTFEVEDYEDPLSTPNPDAPHPALVGSVQKVYSTLPDHYGAISASELLAWMKEEPDLLLVDLRSDDALRVDGEFNTGKVVHIPMVDLILQKSLWPTDRAAPLVLISDNGQEASACLSLMWAYGYQNARALVGGYQAWEVDQ